MPIINTEIKQKSKQWFDKKVGKPSSSNADKLITSTGSYSKSMIKYAQSLGAELYAGRSLNTFKGTDATKFGNDTEEEARSTYSFITGLEVTECGFIEDDLRQYISSPDGLTSDDKEGEGLLEIKCKPVHHLTALLYWEKNKTTPPDYKAQCQFQLFISQRAFCDLYYYSADLPCLTIRQYPNPTMFAAIKSPLSACIAERNITMTKLKAFKESENVN